MVFVPRVLFFHVITALSTVITKEQVHALFIGKISVMDCLQSKVPPTEMPIFYSNCYFSLHNGILMHIGRCVVFKVNKETFYRDIPKQRYKRKLFSENVSEQFCFSSKGAEREMEEMEHVRVRR